jgi:PAS domain S-box-containing protein
MSEREIGSAASDGEGWERRRSEEALRESQIAFHELLEMAPDAVVVTNPDEHVADVNTAACKLFDYSREELLGKTAADLAPPEDAAKLVPHVPALVHGVEGHVLRRDGSLVTIEVSVKNLADGRSVGFLRDITERKRIEQECDESLRWVRAVLEQSPVGLALMHGSRFEQLEFNDRAHEMLGRPWDTDAELQGRLHTLDGQPADPEQLPIVEALRGKRIVGAEFLASNGEGGFTPIGLNAAPIVGRDGVVLGAVAAFEDITAAKELERLRAEWSSVVAHDLRQPLATIGLNAQALARAIHDPRLLATVERVLAAVKRLQRMVADLMDLSRLEASRLELVRRRVDVVALVSGAAERAKLDTADRPFDVRVHGEVPEAYADPDRIEQVLENLLTNAVKYGQAGTRIAVSVERDGQEVAVAVINEGRTLTAEEITRIFERFQRTRSAKLRGIQGVGLGLYITRSLVEAHGGRITAQSTSAGVTTFRFTLPVA